MLCQCKTVCLLICALISENQGPFQTLEKFQIMQTLIFLSGVHPEKSWFYTINLKKYRCQTRNQGLQNLKFFKGLK